MVLLDGRRGRRVCLLPTVTRLPHQFAPYCNIPWICIFIDIGISSALVDYLKPLRMSSSNEEELFRSAQRPQDQIYPEKDQLDSSSVDSYDGLDGDNIATIEAVPQASEAAGDDGGPQPNIAAHNQEEVRTSSEEHSTAPNLPASRPNQYLGPPSTWRNWTAPERDLAASLDQLTAKDISIHLYNAFMLKKSCGTQARVRELEFLNADGNGPNDYVSWTPPKVWTAWPLPPVDVPREEERRWEEAAPVSESFSMKATRSSELLRELIVAQVLRIARARFNDRESEDQDSEASEIRPRKRQSQISLVKGTDHTTQKLKPVVMTDDERASQILRPTVQHVMKRIDDLLLGLHYARKSYLTVGHATSDSESETNDRSTSQRKARKRKHSTSTLDTEIDIASKPEELSTSNTVSRSRSQSKRPKLTSRPRSSQNLRNRVLRLGCRDWSDLLGIASMTGWPPNVVERAAARCSSLFGEGITFRKLEEGSLCFEERTYLPDDMTRVTVSQSKEAVLASDIIGTDNKKSERFGGVHVDGFLQPIEVKKSWKYPKKGVKKRGFTRGSCG